MSIEQIVASAGDGKLKDDSECSREVRTFLGEVPTAALRRCAEHCLTTPFQKSGQVLQDVVNELGRRLDFSVKNGRYQGTTNAIGSDGLWRDPDGHDLVVEVKTTDAYRISLNTIAGYRDSHIATGDVGTPNSMLIVVGREDTGELEAQVRGSPHAWDMRLISVEALLRLVDLKESTEEEATAKKIRGLLRPAEFTRLDGLIDVLFTAAKDVEEKTLEPVEGSAASDNGVSNWQFTAPELLAAKRDGIIAAASAFLGRALIKKTRATYWDSDKTTRAVCTISKRYQRQEPAAYWYAYHPAWGEFLAGGQQSVFILGAMDIDVCFVLPHDVLRKHLGELNTTQKPDGSSYWHIKILEPTTGSFFLQMPKSGRHVPLSGYQVSLAPSAT
jgi:hypothetical protein